MAEKRRTKRKDVKINEGTIAYKWTHGDKRPRGLTIQDIVEKAFQALEQAQSPKTKEEKALDIHKECRAKVSELLPSAWVVYQLAEVLLTHVAQDTPVPDSVWQLYIKEIELAIQSSKAHFASGLPQVRNGTPVQPGFAGGLPQDKSGTPIHQDTQPERLSLAWFERELYNANALLQYYSHDPALRERAINWLHKLKDEATEVQKTKPDPEINTILAKINAAIESQNKASPG